MPSVVRDLDYIAERFGNRATIGTSIPVLNSSLSLVLEPFASPVDLRAQRILGTAKNLGLRRYVMACPIIPGSYRDFNDFADQWSRVVDVYEPEKVWFEPLNGRGKNLDVIDRGLREAGMVELADHVKTIRTMKGWTDYVTELLGWVQRFAAERYSAECVRFLMYPTMPNGRRPGVRG